MVLADSIGTMGIVILIFKVMNLIIAKHTSKQYNKTPITISISKSPPTATQTFLSMLSQFSSLLPSTPTSVPFLPLFPPSFPSSLHPSPPIPSLLLPLSPSSSLLPFPSYSLLFPPSSYSLLHLHLHPHCFHFSQTGHQRCSSSAQWIPSLPVPPAAPPRVGAPAGGRGRPHPCTSSPVGGTGQTS